MTVVGRGLRWSGRSMRGGAGRLGRRGSGFLTAVRAVMVKESRGRMRGRRAFVVLTLYLVLLGVFSFAVYHLVRQNALNAASLNFGQPMPGRGDFGPISSSASQAGLSATIGHALFSSLMALETLLVLVLAPAFTTGAISLEREKQTLELLVTTPLSTLGMVIGKLLSALVYVFLLILASIPFVSIVFPFGGVAPDDLVRAYVVLFALAFGMGAVGMFVSALVRRTQTAMVLTVVLVLALTMGTAGAHHFWRISTKQPARLSPNGQQLIPARNGEAPEQLLWLNPFVSAADLICTSSPSGIDQTCDYLAGVTRKPYFGSVTDFPVDPTCPPEKCMPGRGGIEGTGGGVVADQPASEPAVNEAVPPMKGDGDDASGGPAGVAPGAGADGLVFRDVIADDVGVAQPPVSVSAFGYPRDTFWPSSTMAFLVVGSILTLLSAQLVAPTRRFRIRRLGLRPVSLRRRRPSIGAAAPTTEPDALDGVSAGSDEKPITESPA